MRRLAIVASHPIQYHAPWFRALARVTDLDVFFCHRQDGAGQAAAGFDVEFEWDVPLLDGYRHTWLENRARRPDVSSFFGCDTPDIAHYLTSGAFDACIVSGWYLKSYLQAMRACRRSGIPVIARGDSQLATARSAAWRAAKYLPYRWLLGQMAGHLYVGTANRVYLEYYGVAADRLFFAPHFVDNDFFARGAAAARANGDAMSLRRSLGIADSTLVFAFAGKLIEKKRPADLVRALTSARAAGADVCGLVVGSGPLQRALVDLVSSLHVPVHFAGFRNQTELPRYFAAADALVLPSDAGETWGLVVNEAMACGLPTIVSDAAGCSGDLVDDGRTGYIVPVGNVQRLSDAILALAADVRRDIATIRSAVDNRISRYSCSVAVQGTMAALDAVCPSGDPIPSESAVLGRAGGSRS